MPSPPHSFLPFANLLNRRIEEVCGTGKKARQRTAAILHIDIRRLNQWCVGNSLPDKELQPAVGVFMGWFSGDKETDPDGLLYTIEQFNSPKMRSTPEDISAYRMASTVKRKLNKKLNKKRRKNAPVKDDEARESP